MYPLRRTYTEALLREAGFLDVRTYGDFQENYDPEAAEFLVHVATKF